MLAGPVFQPMPLSFSTAGIPFLACSLSSSRPAAWQVPLFLLLRLSPLTFKDPFGAGAGAEVVLERWLLVKSLLNEHDKI